MIAYLLAHQYSPLNLKSGIKALKGADAHMVANARRVAEDLGYMLCLVNLEHHVHGVAEINNDSYRKRGRYHYEDFSE